MSDLKDLFYLKDLFCDLHISNYFVCISEFYAQQSPRIENLSDFQVAIFSLTTAAVDNS